MSHTNVKGECLECKLSVDWLLVKICHDLIQRSHGFRGDDHIVVGFTTTYAISAYDH
jgi:hypothetical protein